jgi:hypothetical protein
VPGVALLLRSLAPFHSTEGRMGPSREREGGDGVVMTPYGRRSRRMTPEPHGESLKHPPGILGPSLLLLGREKPTKGSSTTGPHHREGSESEWQLQKMPRCGKASTGHTKAYELDLDAVHGLTVRPKVAD